LQWDGTEAAAHRARGQAAMSRLRDPIAAVLVSVLSAERQVEEKRWTDERGSDHLNAELLGTVSHELRSPLAAIKGYASTLLRHERRLPREERHAFLAAIDEASDRLEVLINRLLEMSQLETGTTALHRDVLDLVAVAREAIDRAIDNLRTQTDTSSRPLITFTLQLRDQAGGIVGSEPLILADARAMRELLDNLLQNAVKYSPDGGEVSIEIQPLEGGPARVGPNGGGPLGESEDHAPKTFARGDACLQVIVRDHGVGIPTEHLGRIFDRFHRVDTRLTREVDGLGIGLAICRRLVELHGGTIWAESDPGVGSAFHVVLPIATRADPHQGSQEVQSCLPGR
jgi:signal transduction histidine kinase